MFNKFYEEYLGFESGELLNGCKMCVSGNRDKPLNKKYFYKMIITDYENSRVISVSPEISKDEVSQICRSITNRSIDYLFVLPELTNLKLRFTLMYRMFLTDVSFVVKKLEGIEIIYLDEQKKYVANVDGVTVAYCKISDIYDGYGNIVVWTDIRYRRRGIAKALLKRIILKCNEWDINPMYLVNSDNTASIKLAESVGFKTLQKEVIGCRIEENVS